MFSSVLFGSGLALNVLAENVFQSARFPANKESQNSTCYAVCYLSTIKNLFMNHFQNKCLDKVLVTKLPSRTWSIFTKCF